MAEILFFYDHFVASNRTSALPPLIIPQYDSDKYFGDIDVTVFDFNDVLLNDVLEDNVVMMNFLFQLCPLFLDPPEAPRHRACTHTSLTRRRAPSLCVSLRLARLCDCV